MRETNGYYEHYDPGKSRLTQEQRIDLLTPAEVEVLQGVAKGYENQHISELRGSRQKTVEKHLENMYKKLGNANRTEAARLAWQTGLFNPFEFEGVWDNVGNVQNLSPQEINVLDFLSFGMTNSEISRKLMVSVNTIETHVANIHTTLQVPNRTRAAMTWYVLYQLSITS